MSYGVGNLSTFGHVSCAGVVFALVGCNHAPGPARVELGPSAPTTLDDLVVEIVQEAPDVDGGDTVRYRAVWYVDGSLAEGVDGLTLPSSNTAKGQTWRVEVTPTDGRADGPTTSDEVVILNSAPVLEVSFSPDPATSADELEAVVSVTDVDEDDVTYSCTWTWNGEPMEGQSCTVMEEDTVRGDEWTVLVEGSDGEDAAAPVSAARVIQNGLPEVLDLVLEPAEPTVEDAIAADFEVHDADGDPVTVLVEWEVDGVVVQSGEGTELTEMSPTRGSVVSVSVTANDGFDDGVSATATVEIANAMPTEPVVRIRPGWPRAGMDDAVCVVKEESTDADGDGLSYEISWTVDGSPYTGEVESTTLEGDTIPAELLGATETWTCTVSAYDGLGYSPAVSWQVVPTCPDIDCDGWPDILFANYRSNDSYYDNPVYIYLGDETGFAEDRRIELPATWTMSAAVGDLDNDGFLDVFVTNFSDGDGHYSTESLIYWGTGAGIATSSPTGLTTYSAKYATISDLDDDGYHDIVVSSQYGDESSLFWGAPDGLGADEVTTLPTSNATQHEVADLNNDGTPEVIFSNRHAGGDCSIDSYVYWNRSGVFSEGDRTDLPTHCAHDVTAADIDLDGWPDLVFSNEKQKSGDTDIYDIDSYVYWGSGSGFSAANRLDLPTTYAVGNTIADLNDDGLPDVVFTNYYDGESYLLDSYVYWGSSGGLGSSHREGLPTCGALDVEAGDLDGDGYLDLVLANSRDSEGAYDMDSVIYWGAPGGFSESSVTYLPTLSGRGIVLIGVE